MNQESKQTGCGCKHHKERIAQEQECCRSKLVQPQQQKCCKAVRADENQAEEDDSYEDDIEEENEIQTDDNLDNE